MLLSTDNSAQAHFSRVPSISGSRNAFTVADPGKGTMKFDYLYPLYWKQILPGDTLSATFSVAMRLGTQVATLYDELYYDIHAWYAPNRILQDNWARLQFNDKPAGPSQDNSSLTAPTIDLSGLTSGFGSKSLYDYLQYGDPTLDLTAAAADLNNYLPRMYNLTWNQDYRDQNLQDPVVVDKDDGPDDPADYVLLKRGKRHDKFTSMLTDLQKGTPVSLQLSGEVDVQYSNTNVGAVWRDRSDGSLHGTNQNIESAASGTVQGANNTNVHYDPNGTLIIDSSNIQAFTVNSLRTTVAVQHLLEADARGGTRDVEAIKNRFNTQVPDFRLSRPEYLGGATYSFDGHLVPQTSETGTTPQGNLAQFSDSAGALQINHSFVEHGWLMILCSARSNQTYQQGVPRELRYNTRYDWFQPEMSNIGEVGVLNSEWYFQGDDGTEDDAIAGYQEYGYELRYGNTFISAEMRSSFATSKDYTHMAYEFSSLPVLGSSFIQSDTPIDRNLVVASATADPIEYSTIMKGTCARMLPMYSVPGLEKL